MFYRESADLVEIHFAVDSLVSDEVEYFGEKRHRSTVGQVSSMGEIHSENSITRIHERRIYT